MPSLRKFFLAAALIAPVFLSGTSLPASAESVVPQGQDEITLSFAPLVKKVVPGVVNIFTRKVVQANVTSPLFNDPFFGRFFQNMMPGQTRKRVENSLGSGVIVDGSGIVITNNHVIAGADQIRVVLSDKREFDAKLILTDKRTDVAVLRLEGVKGKLPQLTLGDSDALEVGDLVLAIGNPFGVGQTVTSGIVSGLARTAVGVTDYQSFIQTDAAINPGNSGGALVDVHGNVIGINTAILTKSGGSHGIGFAVPANMVKAVLRAALSGKKLVHPWVGFSGRDVDSDMAEALGLPAPQGVIVESVHRGGPADDAGLKQGDVVIKIAGHEISDAQELRFRLATREVGTSVDMTYLRDGAEKHASFKLMAPPEDPPRDETVIGGRTPVSGAKVVNLSPAVAAEYGFPSELTGVAVIDVASRSPAAQVGVQPGDLILEINGDAIKQVADLKPILNDPPGVWHVVLERNGQKLTLEIR